MVAATQAAAMPVTVRGTNGTTMARATTLARL
jgi:hypothetical protein